MRLSWKKDPLPSSSSLGQSSSPRDLRPKGLILPEGVSGRPQQTKDYSELQAAVPRSLVCRVPSDATCLLKASERDRQTDSSRRLIEF